MTMRTEEIAELESVEPAARGGLGLAFLRCSDVGLLLLPRMAPFIAIVLVLVVVGGICSAALATWWYSTEQKARRAIAAAPRRQIADAIEGELVRLVGEIQVDAPIAAPLSGRACACCRVVVEEQKRTGNNRTWKKIVDEHEAVDFLICDESDAKALVRTPLVHAVLEEDARYTSGLLNDASPELEAFLARRGLKSEGWIFNKTMRYREGTVEPGETVAVVGIGRWERDPDEEASAGQGYREARMPERLVLQAPEGRPLLLSDEREFTR